jgi:hypothetical protein
MVFETQYVGLTLNLVGFEKLCPALMIVLTNAMEQSPLEADSSSAAREIRRVL